jgi:hypothetical protein
MILILSGVLKRMEVGVVEMVIGWSKKEFLVL